MKDIVKQGCVGTLPTANILNSVRRMWMVRLSSALLITVSTYYQYRRSETPHQCGKRYSCCGKHYDAKNRAVYQVGVPGAFVKPRKISNHR